MASKHGRMGVVMKPIVLKPVNGGVYLWSNCDGSETYSFVGAYFEDAEHKYIVDLTGGNFGALLKLDSKAEHYDCVRQITSISKFMEQPIVLYDSNKF